MWDQMSLIWRVSLCPGQQEGAAEGNGALRCSWFREPQAGRMRLPGATEIVELHRAALSLGAAVICPQRIFQAAGAGGNWTCSYHQHSRGGDGSVIS